MFEEFKDLWGVEYSPKQKCFNVSSIGMILRDNTDIVFEQTGKISEATQYYILGIFKTQDEAYEFVKVLKEEFYIRGEYQYDR